MYGLDKNENINFLVGKELLQVCVGAFQVILILDNDITITLECEYEYEFNSQKINCSSDIPEQACSLLKSLGSKITNISNLGNGDIELGFSGGSVLKIYDSNKNSESYQIISPQKDIIV